MTETDVDILMHGLKLHSFRNYHARGVDYVCLSRHKLLTVKAYFFDDGLQHGNVFGVVSPHDHRYDFASEVVAGRLHDVAWAEDSISPVIAQRFLWRSPLCGGSGFAWDAEVRLTCAGSQRVDSGQRYLRSYDAIHTLATIQPRTVVVQRQYASARGSSEPTRTYCRDREPPSLDGLYEKHNSDQIITRLRQLEVVRPGLCAAHGLGVFVD